MNDGFHVWMLGLALFSLPLTARAQDDAAPDDPAPTAPATTASAPAPTPAPAAAAPTAGTACLLSNNGLDPASARTGGQIVCDEIRNQGVAISENPNVSYAYRVTFDRLGQDLIVRVTYEAPIGSVIRSRRIVLAGPEEVPIAAPRLARAIVHDEALSESERVDNLVKQETRKYEKKSGEFLWGFGVLGVSAPAEKMWMSPGLEFMGYYETPEFGFGFSLRAAFDGGSGKSFSSSSFSVGGRYFLSAGEFSPFLGAGIGISGSNIKQEQPYSKASGSGLAAFGEVGVEFMRLHSSRFIVGLRLEAPFYKLESESYSWDSSSSSAGPGPESRYVMPLTLSATYAW